MKILKFLKDLAIFVWLCIAYGLLILFINITEMFKKSKR